MLVPAGASAGRARQWDAVGEACKGSEDFGTIPALFERSAARVPGDIAIEHWPPGGGPARPLRYGELLARVLEAARRLASVLGAVRTCTALGVDEGPAMVILELAVLFGGSFFLPLDLRHPVKRLQHMLSEVGAPVLLASSAWAASVAALELVASMREPSEDYSTRGTKFRVEAFEAFVQVDVSCQATLSLAEALGSCSKCSEVDICYVQYTSGSTGVPKGVVCEQRQAAWYALAKAREEHVQSGSRLLLTAAFTFDPCQGDTFCALCNGATLVLADRVDILHNLADLINMSLPTHLCATPAVWRLADAVPASMQSLRCLSLGGEAMPQPMVKMCANMHEHFQLRNVYGVTEVTVYQTSMRMDAETPSKYAGLPLPGCCVSIRPWPEDASPSTFDEGDFWRCPTNEGSCARDPEESCCTSSWFSSLPFGAVGEVWLGGPGVARGYVGRPDLTAEKFVSVSVGEGPVHRAYRTGDCGRWVVQPSTDLLDASAAVLELVGRRDSQVKINGERIELGDVEQTLAACSLIASCVVVAAADGGSLMAYVVLKDAEPYDSIVEAALHAHCRRCLPRSSVPTRYFALEKLPMTPNGKINRQALPEIPPPDMVAAGSHGLPPKDSLEESIALAWAAEMAVSDVAGNLGREADFFQLGGGSIQAVRITRALRVVLKGGGGGERFAEGKSDWQDPAGDASLFLAPENAGDAECHFGFCEGGPFRPCALLERPVLWHYAEFLRSSGVRVAQSDLPRDAHVVMDERSNPSSGVRGELSAEPEGVVSDPGHNELLSRDALDGVSGGVVEGVVSDPGHNELLSRAAFDGVSGADPSELRLSVVLQAAIRRCRVSVVQTLLRARVNPSGVMRARQRGVWPLHWAATLRDPQISRALLEHCAPVLCSTERGALPTHVAAASSASAVLEELFLFGAPPLARDAGGQGVLHYAGRAGCAECVRIAIRYGAAKDLASFDRQSRSPLHWAVRASWAPAVEALLEAGADPNPPKVAESVHKRRTRLKQESPLELAANLGHADIQAMLVGYGARL